MPARRDPVFRRRLVSALILGPLAAALVIYGGMPFTMWVAAFAAAMAWEWVTMSDREAPPIAYAIACSTATGAVLLAGEASLLAAAAWAGAGAAAAGAESLRRTTRLEFFGVFYVAITAALLAGFRADPDDGLVNLVLLFTIVWSTDSFAYLVGTWIGGPKLLPQLSPNKTWSGLLAGVAAGLIGALIAGFIFSLDPGRTLAYALVVALASVGGDLLMSVFKRSFGVKDSGSLIPGHGGVLDRVDALMLAVLCAVPMDRLLDIVWPAA